MIASEQTIAPADVADHYDELDAFYRDVWGEHVHHGLWLDGDESREVAVRQMVELIASEAELKPGNRVCDIGCGYGATARMLARDWKVAVTGYTISPAQHAYAVGCRVNGAPQPIYTLGDWLSADVEESAFDAAIACESSEHMPDKAAFFRRAGHALKPGGRLVVCAWLSCDHPSRSQERWLLEPICREGRMPHLGTAAEYRELAADAGFHCFRSQDFSREVASTWPRIAWIFLEKLFADPRYVRFVCNRHARNRVFALTVFRLWIAFRTGAMHYGVFTFVKRQ